MTWQERGACRPHPTEWWFPEGHDHTPAQQICGTCPVQAQCLQWAVETPEYFGTWGGKSQQELSRIRRDHPSRLMARIAAEIEAGVAV